MRDNHRRGMFVALLGTVIAAASIGTLIWGPSGRISDAIAFMLVITTVIGVALVIMGASAALKTEEEPERETGRERSLPR